MDAGRFARNQLRSPPSSYPWKRLPAASDSNPVRTRDKEIAWFSLGRSLRRRGLVAPRTAVSFGSMGCWFEQVPLSAQPAIAASLSASMCENPRIPAGTAQTLTSARFRSPGLNCPAPEAYLAAGTGRFMHNCAVSGTLASPANASGRDPRSTCSCTDQKSARSSGLERVTSSFAEKRHLLMTGKRAGTYRRNRRLDIPAPATAIVSSASSKRFAG